MSGGSTSGHTPSILDSIATLFITVAFSCVGWLCVAILCGIRVEIKLLKINFKTRNFLKCVTIPPLVGMIIFGTIPRNVIPYVETEYNDEWATYLRMVCLSVILTRGGLELEFKNKGMTVVFLTLIPQIMEASAVALFTFILFGMPFALCYALGFIIGAVSPAVLVPSCMILQS